jgi:hypothetical protein
MGALLRKHKVKIRSVVQTTSCKICRQQAELYGVRDFNTSCNSELPANVCHPLSGLAIYYHQCTSCGLIFTRAFDDWDPQDYAVHIYNDEYIQHDPEFVAIRPQKNLEVIMQTFKGIRDWRVLDYGGGDGQLATLLNNEGVIAQGWDPFHGSGIRPKGGFDFICSFEVFEHTPTPESTLQDLHSFLNPRGVIFFSTLVHDGRAAMGINNPYIAPRNGHITIHSRESLKHLFSKIGMNILHLNDAFHIAFTPADNG